jgi:hypothetical protein
MASIQRKPGRRLGAKTACIEDARQVPQTVKEVVSLVQSGNEITLANRSDRLAKMLPAIQEGYNTNRYLEGSRRGKPPKYTPRKMGQKVDKYFNKCDSTGKPPTITGLMLYLGLGREQFYYNLSHPYFGPIMLYARDRIENWLEEQLVTIKHNPTGIIFALKNRHGWKDVQTTEINYNNLTERELMAKLEALAPDLVQALTQKALIHDADFVDIVDKDGNIIEEGETSANEDGGKPS